MPKYATSGNIRLNMYKSMYQIIEHCLQNAICNCDMHHLQIGNGELEHDTWNLMTCERGNLNVSNFELGDFKPEAFKLRHLLEHILS